MNHHEDNNTAEANQKCGAKPTQGHAEITYTHATDSSTVEPRQVPSSAAAIPSTIADNPVADTLHKLCGLPIGIQVASSSALPANTATDDGGADDPAKGDIQVGTASARRDGMVSSVFSR